MKPRGNVLGVFLALVLALASAGARAELSASVDRDRVAMGDTLRLTITATGEDTLDQLDLGPLAQDFQLLQRSTSSSTKIINGRASHTRQMLIDMTPRREGSLRVPPLRSATGISNFLLIAVGPAPQADTGGEHVIFEAEVDRDKVYVQGQVLLTLRVQQSINLDSRSVTELQLENAFVKQLDQKSFQRTIDGRPWLVHEIRYAIFPEQSGELIIPAQTFSARESRPRRGLFDLNNSGRQLRRDTETVRIDVLPRPQAFPAGTWLPARRIEVEETWSTPPEQLRAGESATRTVRISGEGLQGAQLPPVLFSAGEGLKYYPDQPAISDTEVGTGLLGVREDSAALVPTRAGEWEIPEMRIPWWDTETESLQHAVIPARTLVVSPATTTGQATAEIGAGAAATPTPDVQTLVVQDSGNLLLWQSIAALSTAGWLLSLLYLLRNRRDPVKSPASTTNRDIPEGKAFKQLLAACASGDAHQARRDLLAWCRTLPGGAEVYSLDAARELLGEDDTQPLLGEIDSALYAGEDTQWDGEKLAAMVRELRPQLRNQAQREVRESLRLYPA